MELDHLSVIDWELGIKLAGNKRDLAEEILNMLIKNLPDDMSAITQLYHDKNYLGLLQRVHKLHGAICYCGLPRLKTVLSHLETDLKSHIMDSLPSLHDQLHAEVNLLLEHYSRLPS